MSSRPWVRRQLALAAAGALLVTGCVSACGYQPVPPDRLELGNQDNYQHCAVPTKTRTWDAMHETSTQFALDDLVVKGDKPITITKVELVPPSTRLSLEQVAVVPLGDSVESVFPFGDPRSIGDKEAWDKRQVLPATLTRLHPTQAVKDEYGAGAAQWQVVIGVEPTGVNDTADAIAIHYTVDGRSSVLVGRHSFAVTKTQADCTKDGD